MRCAHCGHSWRQAPDAAAADEAAAAGMPASPAAPGTAAADISTAAAAREPAHDPPPLTAPPPDGGMPPPHTRHRLRMGVGSLAGVALVAIIVLVAIFARHGVVAMWPGAESVYRLAGLRVEPLGAGLEIRKVIPTRTGEGLVVEGEVVNIDGGARRVPQLRVALLDPAQKELRYEIIAPPKNRLEPGETIQFRAPFAKTDENATKVAVTWASG